MGRVVEEPRPSRAKNHRIRPVFRVLGGRKVVIGDSVGITGPSAGSRGIQPGTAATIQGDRSPRGASPVSVLCEGL